MYEFSVSPSPWRHLLLSIFFYYGHPSGLWSGIVVVDLLFLIGYDVEQLFMWFIAHIFRERSTQILYLFLDWVFYLLWLSFQVLCIKNCRDFSALGMFINNQQTWHFFSSPAFGAHCLEQGFADTSFLGDMWFANISFHSVGCLFTFWMVSFEAHTFQILIMSSLSIFSFVTWALGVISKKPLPKPGLWRFTSVFYKL